MKTPARNWALKFSTLIVVTACFVVLLGTLVLGQNFRNVLTLWGEDVQMSVYLSQDLSESGRTFIENKIKTDPHVEKITLVTQEQALEDFRVQMASYAPDIHQDEELLRLIPASFQVKLASAAGAAEHMNALQNLAQELKALEGVEEVSYGQEWIAKYATLMKTFETVLTLLGAVILSAVLFVISNVIRASVASRKEEIVVLEMIGATPAMIRRPFMKEGAVLGFFSSAFAVMICFGLYMGIKGLLVEKLNFFQLNQHLQFPNMLIWTGFVAGGCLLGALASYLCVRKINDGFAGRSQGSY